MTGDELNNEDASAGNAGDCNGIVLVHDGPDSAARAARLLSWYDASANVAPREVKCDCVDSAGHPATACPRCHGTGRWLALDNPDAKFASARSVATWRNWDVSALARFAASQCRAIVTPDGEWHGRGGLDERGWSEEVLYLLSDHSHFVALGYRFALVASE